MGPARGGLWALQGLGFYFSHERLAWGFWKVVVAASSDFLFNFIWFWLCWIFAATRAFPCCRGWVCALIAEPGLRGVQASVVVGPGLQHRLSS